MHLLTPNKPPLSLAVIEDESKVLLASDAKTSCAVLKVDAGDADGVNEPACERRNAKKIRVELVATIAIFLTTLFQRTFISKTIDCSSF